MEDYYYAFQNLDPFSVFYIFVFFLEPQEVGMTPVWRVQRNIIAYDGFKFKPFQNRFKTQEERSEGR